MARLSRVIRKVSFIGMYGAALAIGVMFLVMSLEVVMRYLFNRPSGYSIDLAEILLLLIFYLPVAAVTMDGQTIRVDVVVNRLRPKLRLWLEVVGTFIALCGVVVLVWSSYLASRDSLVYRPVTQYAMLPIYPFIPVVTIAMVVLFFILISQLVAQLMQIRQDKVK